MRRFLSHIHFKYLQFAKWTQEGISTDKLQLLRCTARLSQCTAKSFTVFDEGSGTDESIKKIKNLLQIPSRKYHLLIKFILSALTRRHYFSAPHR
jgi:hypothetical protein